MSSKILQNTAAVLMSIFALSAVAFGATEGLLNRQQEVRISIPKPRIRFEVNLPVPEPVLQIIDQIQGNTSPLFCPAPQRNEPVCSLDSIDVSSPSNNFDLMWRCDGELRPCGLTANGQPIGSVRGIGTAHLTLPSTLGTYQLTDRNGRSCGTAIIHGYRSSGAIQLTTPAPVVLTRTYEQSAYRWHLLNDAANPTVDLAANNTRPTVNQFSSFGFRALIHIGNVDLSAGATTFKLQRATKGASCAASVFSDLDVAGTASGLTYYNQTTPANAAAITTSAVDPSHGADTIVPQRYHEQNNFTSASAIAAGQDGMWDFAVYTGGFDNQWCLRIVKSDGTALDTYTQYIELNVSGGGG